MKKPRMILFDYGGTLAKEAPFDGVKGTQAVLRHAVQNKYGLTARQVQAEADAINRELSRYDPKGLHLLRAEMPNHMFTAYLYESLGIELALSADEIDKIFWDAAAPGRPTDGIEDFLAYLYENGIRTGVISNIPYAGNVVRERISTLLPENHFECILPTSDYLFRKPNPRIFRLALEKADVRAEDAWYAGDHYECDIVGARSAGLFPVWYQGAKEAAEPPADGVLAVASWKDLENMMEDK